MNNDRIVMPTSVGTYFYEPTVDEVTRNRLHVEYLMIHDLNTRIMPCDTFLDLAVPVAQWLRVLQSIN